jgi:hypothetical protein
MEKLPLLGIDLEALQQGATCVVLLGDFVGFSTKRQTIYVKPGGTPFLTLEVHGLTGEDAEDETNWEPALSPDVDGNGVQQHIVADPLTPKAYVIDAGYAAVRVTGTGGVPHNSTLEAAFIV